MESKVLALSSPQILWHRLIAGLVVSVVNPQPGESIIDCCAAPGGKTLYMASLMDGQGIFKNCCSLFFQASITFCTWLVGLMMFLDCNFLFILLLLNLSNSHYSGVECSVST